MPNTSIAHPAGVTAALVIDDCPDRAKVLLQLGITPYVAETVEQAAFVLGMQASPPWRPGVPVPQIVCLDYDMGYMVRHERKGIVYTGSRTIVERTGYDIMAALLSPTFGAKWTMGIPVLIWSHNDEGGVTELEDLIGGAKGRGWTEVARHSEDPHKMAAAITNLMNRWRNRGNTA